MHNYIIFQTISRLAVVQKRLMNRTIFNKSPVTDQKLWPVITKQITTLSLHFGGNILCIRILCIELADDMTVRMFVPVLAEFKNMFDGYNFNFKGNNRLHHFADIFFIHFLNKRW